MVFRKPYAFIIQNFKKIHILLLALSIYIYFKNSQILGFVNEFIITNTYNPMVESIRSYISLFIYLALIVTIFISAVLIYILRYKKKPWKAYLLPFFSYIFLFIVIYFTARFFNQYGDDSTLVMIRTLGQLLQMGSLLQYAIFLLLFIRITGIDLKKFDFVHDQEFLEIKEEDREEFEVNLEFDKENIIRLFKKQWRHAKYLYQEHPLVFNVIFSILGIILISYTYYYFGILHKTFKEGEDFDALSYQITIEDSYFTDKNYSGNVIKEGKDYLAIVVKMKNNGSKRAINPDRFHLLNRSHSYSYTKLVDSSFKDLGSSVPSRELANQEEVTFYLVYEIDKGLSAKKFVLYYQDIRGINGLLFRKVKLSPLDLHEVKTIETKKVGESMSLSGVGISNFQVILMDASIKDKDTYPLLSCQSSNCTMISKTVQNKDGKLLVLEMASEDFEDKDFVDFSTGYGKIEYKDNKGTKVIAIRNAVQGDYVGKTIYAKVPNDIEKATSIRLIYTIRNRSYVYKIK